jgi:hypothetical protein
VRRRRLIALLRTWLPRTIEPFIDVGVGSLSLDIDDGEREPGHRCGCNQQHSPHVMPPSRSGFHITTLPGLTGNPSYERMDARVKSAFTRVFNALCPRMVLKLH